LAGKLERVAVGKERRTVEIKNLVSIIIPARNEQFLRKTIEDLLIKAEGEIEIIAVLDGYWPDPILQDPRVIYIHRGIARGMRAAINSAVAIAKGKYILKTDAHCMWGPGFDKILAADCQKDWVAVPTRKRLDAENWCIQEAGRPDIEYMFLSYPNDPKDFSGEGLNGKNWDQKNKDEELKKVKIDDLMSAQGSAWFMRKDYFHKLELMDESQYGKFWNEFQEIGLKCWLSGGRVIVDKNTWYAHLHKGKKYGRGYTLPEEWLKEGRNHTIKWLKFKKAWDKQTLPLSWLVEHFWPVPTWTQEGLDKLKATEK